MLSIIIPTYNSNKYLSEILHTLSEVSELEIIVVDDCGTEPVTEISSQFPFAKFFSLAENSGAGFSRNFGLEKATKRFVTFVDADDSINISELQNAMALLKNSTSDVLYFKPTSHDENGALGKRHEPYADLLNIALAKNDQAYKYKFHVPWSKIYLRDFLLYNGIAFDEVSASNDVMFSLRCGLKSQNTEVINNVAFYSVLQHKSGLTGVDTLSRLESRISVAINFNKLLESNKLLKYRTSILPLLWRLFKIKCLYKYLITREVKISFFRDVLPSSYTIKKLLR